MQQSFINVFLLVIEGLVFPLILLYVAYRLNNKD